MFGSANLRELLEAHVETDPEKRLLFSAADGRDWTYREFNEAVNRTANMLRARGIGKGDVVSLLLPNSAEYVIAYFACWQLGALPSSSRWNGRRKPNQRSSLLCRNRRL